MMYYSFLASFCLLGMASSQTIKGMTACLTKDQNLRMNCTFTPKESSALVSCVYTMDKKVVATTDTNIVVDSTFKNRATINLTKNVCELTLKGFPDNELQTYNCTIYQEKINSTMAKTVEKKNMDSCSDGNVLKHDGAILLLAFVLPLLSGML